MIRSTWLISQVRRSAQPKCERCWRYVPDVAQDTRYPTVCLRCAEALEAIGFAPYSSEPACVMNRRDFRPYLLLIAAIVMAA